jgi:hypothetical protein
VRQLNLATKAEEYVSMWQLKPRTILDYELPNGVRIGSATKEGLLEAMQRYRLQSHQALITAEQLCRLASMFPEGTSPDATLDDIHEAISPADLHRFTIQLRRRFSW